MSHRHLGRAGRQWLLIAAASAWVAVAGAAPPPPAAVSAASASPAKSPPAAGALFAKGTAKLTPGGERWLRTRVAQSATRADRMVVVSIGGQGVAGAAQSLQQQRVKVLRQRLTAMGVPAARIYFEST